MAKKKTKKTVKKTTNKDTAKHMMPGMPKMKIGSGFGAMMGHK